MKGSFIFSNEVITIKKHLISSFFNHFLLFKHKYQLLFQTFGWFFYIIQKMLDQGSYPSKMMDFLYEWKHKSLCWFFRWKLENIRETDIDFKESYIKVKGTFSCLGFKPTFLHLLVMNGIMCGSSLCADQDQQFSELTSGSVECEVMTFFQRNVAAAGIGAWAYSWTAACHSWVLSPLSSPFNPLLLSTDVIATAVVGRETAEVRSWHKLYMFEVCSRWIGGNRVWVTSTWAARIMFSCFCRMAFIRPKNSKLSPEILPTRRRRLINSLKGERKK